MKSTSGSIQFPCAPVIFVNLRLLFATDPDGRISQSQT